MPLRRGILTLLVLLVLTGCGQDVSTPAAQSPRALTQAEGERLAVARFNNYNRRRGAFRMTVPGTPRYALDGRVDWTRHLGYARITSPAQPGAGGLLQWSLTTVALRQGAVVDLPEPPPATGWQARPLTVTAATIDVALSLVLNIAFDRPENPLLLSQNGARWLGSAEVAGRSVDIFSGPAESGRPSKVRYYVDATGNLLRVDATVSQLPEPVVIVLLAEPAAPITPVSALSRPGSAAANVRPVPVS